LIIYANSTYVTMVLFGKLDPQFSTKYLLLKIKDKQAEIVDQYDYPYFVESSQDGFTTVFHPYSGWYLPVMSYDFTDYAYKVIYPVTSGDTSTQDVRFVALSSGESFEDSILAARESLYRISTLSSGIYSGSGWEEYFASTGISCVEVSRQSSYPYVFTSSIVESGVAFYQKDGGDMDNNSVFIDRTTNHPQTQISKIRSE